jgi:hypothetical protein
MGLNKEDIQKIFLEGLETLVLPQLENIYQKLAEQDAKFEKMLDKKLDEKLAQESKKRQKEHDEIVLSYSEQAQENKELIGHYFQSCTSQKSHDKLKERVEKVEDIVLA